MKVLRNNAVRRVSARQKVMRVAAAATVVFSSLAVSLPAAAAPATSVAGWGYNGFGMLGTGTVVNSLVGKPIPGVSDVDKVAAGGLHSLVLSDDGTVAATGYNGLGALGDGTETDSNTLVSVDGLTDVAQVSAGTLHNLAVKDDGTVWGWGYNVFGQLGSGNTLDQNVPVKVEGLSGVVSVSAGYFHSMALKSDGTVWAWGHNSLGAVGDGTTVDRHVPTPVSGLTGIQQISAGYFHSLALDGAGVVTSWGYNGFGQLGNATRTDAIVPVKVLNIGGAASKISGGGFHSLAARTSGSVRAWGYNAYGQLGNGGRADHVLPVTVSNLTSPDQIAAGYAHNVARKGASAFAWGYNGVGPLGDGTTTDRLTPVKVKNLTDVSFVSAGLLHSLAAGKFDAVKPALALPSAIVKEAPGPGGLVVEYTVTATDAVDGSVDVTCAPPSGSTFVVGETAVECSAADSQGNTATDSFKVTVQDTTAPVLDVPADITRSIELGQTDAVVEYTATATDVVDGAVEVTCEPASGSRFPLGTTTVNCSAADAAGNTATDSFTVTVTLL